MEQRQSDDSNPTRTTPSDAPAPDVQPRATQAGESGPTPPQTGNQPAGNRQDNPQRTNRNGEPRNGEPRSERNRDGGPRDGGPRDGNQREGGRNQRDNRQQQQKNGPDDKSTPANGTPTNERPERGQRPNQQNQQRPKQQRDGQGQPANGQRPAENRQRDESQNERSRPANENRNGQRDSIAQEAGLGQRDASGQPAQPAETNSRGERLVIGISLGDYNGIGPEVILKALQYNRLQKICTPVIYGSMRILNRYRNLLNLKDWNLNGAQTIGQISHKLTNVITCWPDQNQDIQPGQVTADAGQAALACLQRAVDDLKDGKIDALVTAPIKQKQHSVGRV